MGIELISDRTERLLARLREFTRGWAVHLRKRDVLQVAGELGGTGEPLAALCLHSLAYSPTPFVSQAAGSAIRRLVEEAPPEVLVALDRIAREIYYRLEPLPKEQVARPKLSGRDRPFVLGEPR